MLNEQEKLSVTQTCVDEVAGRAPVVAHWRISTRETIRLGQQIEKLGVDAVSVIALLRTAETGRVDCALQRNCRRTEHSDVSL